MKRILITLFVILLASTIFFQTARAVTPITGCQIISVANAEYQLQNNINANVTAGDYPIVSCLEILNDNIILDLNNFKISNANASMKVGISISGNNVTIINGMITGFIYGDTGTAYGITNSHNSGTRIQNVILKNNTVGLSSKSSENGFYQFASISEARADSGSNEIEDREGFFVLNETNSKFTVSSESYYPALLYNINNVTVSGNFNSYLPYTILGIPFNTFSVAIYANNATNCIFKDITATGQIQGILVTGDSSNNIFAKIDLPMSTNRATGFMATAGWVASFIGGKEGGIFLDDPVINNILCEINGNVFDDCSQSVYITGVVGSCSQKNNVYYESCDYIQQISGTYTVNNIQNQFLTPLFPTITSSYYPWVSFITTPFFLAMLIVTGISTAIAKFLKPEFGIYTMIILVILTTVSQMTTIWFALIFVIIIGTVAMKVFGGLEVDRPWAKPTKIKIPKATAEEKSIFKRLTKE